MDECIRNNHNLIDVLMAIQTAVVITDRQSHKIIFANQSAAELLGNQLESLIGQECLKRQAESRGGQWHECDCGQTIVNQQSTVLRPDGTFCPVIKSKSPIVFNGRNCLLESFSDISPLMEMREKQQESMKLLEKANRLMEGREKRIREIKKEVNELTKGMGWGPVYTSLEEEYAPVESPGSEYSDEIRKTALSLIEDAEIGRKKAVDAYNQLVLIKQAFLTSADALFISGKDGDSLLSSFSFDTTFGYSPLDISMQGPGLLFAEKNQYEQLSTDLVKEGIFANEVVAKTESGRTFPAFLSVSSILDDEGEERGKIWRFTDISERKEAERIIAEDLERKKHLLRKAMILQRSFIQTALPLLDNCSIRGLYLPCETLGGDFFKVVRASCSRKMAIVLGDCTGHGIQSSMDASILSRIIDRNLYSLFESNRTDLFLQNISREYGENADEDLFPTVFVMVFDYSSKEIFYSNANSLLPLVKRDGEVFPMPSVAGFNIGYFDNPIYERARFPLRDKDRFLLFSDAFIESVDGKDVSVDKGMISELFNSVEGNCSSSFQQIADMALSDKSPFNQYDDRSLVLVEFLDEKEVNLEFRELDEWKLLMDQIRSLLETFDYSGTDILPFLIALDEMCINAFRHGHRSDSSKTVTVKGHVNCRFMEFTIIDEGEGFNYSEIQNPAEIIEELMENDNEDAYSHGRGIYLTRSYVDSLEYNRKGNSVTIKKEKKERTVLTLI